MLSKGSELKGTPDLEPDRADLDGEDPVAVVQAGDGFSSASLAFRVALKIVTSRHRPQPH